MIRILATGALATVQDAGRFDALRWGVGRAGAMDGPALSCGNLLVGNAEDAACIEVQAFPLDVAFDADCFVALTGADCAATLDGAPLLPWTGATVKAGAIMRLGPVGAARWRGARTYVCVAGGIDVPHVLGSRATQLRGGIGGFRGRALLAGDELPVGQATQAMPPGIGIVPPGLALPLTEGRLPAVRVLPAAEYEAYTPASRAALWSQPWKVTAQSDRYGFRLAGPTLEPIAPLELRSHGIVPGVIQVPPGGQPIVQMCDAQPSGGYPKIGAVIEADLWRLGQAPIGSSFRFVETDWQGALAARDEVAAWLASVRTGLGLLRARSGAA